MEYVSLIDKFKTLMNIIISSPLFLFCSMMGVAVLIYYIISIKKDPKINKWIFISIWLVLAILVLINYNEVVFKVIDNLFDDIFTALYFPNLTIYVIIISITNFFFFYSIFSKRVKKGNKILNFINTLILDILLVLIVDIVSKNNINVYEQLNIYSNSQLLTLLELTSALFTSWILLTILLSAHRKLRKYDVKESSELPEIIFEDIK